MCNSCYTLSKIYSDQYLLLIDFHLNNVFLTSNLGKYSLPTMNILMLIKMFEMILMLVVL